MKKLLLLLTATCLISGCERGSITIDSDVVESVKDDGDTHLKKKFTFTLKGEFGAATFNDGDDGMLPVNSKYNSGQQLAPRHAMRSNAYLQSNGQDMTDLWVYDYIGETCVQMLHQTNEDADFGKPSMQLSYGNHHIYFVASRGDSPSIDNDGHTIVWGIPRDTFWKDYEVDVVSTSNGNRAVTLDRVVTKLRVQVDDEVPTGCTVVAITPDKWYYGIDYVTGNPVSCQKQERTISVPESYAGTSGQLALSIFGISSTSEWVTNISIHARNYQGNVLGSAQINGAPFKANRATEYCGNLFSSGGLLSISLSENWENPAIGTW